MRERPRLVVMLMTPVSASVPYNTLFAPRSTSTRSTPVVARSEKSKAPPMSLAGTPSISTFVKLEAPPRTKSDVRPPRAPVWTTSVPGTVRSDSSRSMFPSASSSAASSTVTEAPICDCGSSAAAAVTTTCCVTPPTWSPT